MNIYEYLQMTIWMKFERIFGSFEGLLIEISWFADSNFMFKSFFAPALSDLFHCIGVLALSRAIEWILSIASSADLLQVTTLYF